jgi:(p)ppGpp synthase/HD superfamily hydrolase
LHRDTGANFENIQHKFGRRSPAGNWVTKLDSIDLPPRQQKAESFRKMIVAMAKDLRVFLISLPTLHNLRTLKVREVSKAHRHGARYA